MKIKLAPRNLTFLINRKCSKDIVTPSSLSVFIFYLVLGDWRVGKRWRRVEESTKQPKSSYMDGIIIASKKYSIPPSIPIPSAVARSSLMFCWVCPPF